MYYPCHTCEEQLLTKPRAKMYATKHKATPFLYYYTYYRYELPISKSYEYHCIEIGKKRSFCLLGEIKRNGHVLPGAFLPGFIAHSSCQESMCASLGTTISKKNAHFLCTELRRALLAVFAQSASGTFFTKVP